MKTVTKPRYDNLNNSTAIDLSLGRRLKPLSILITMTFPMVISKPKYHWEK